MSGRRGLLVAGVGVLIISAARTGVAGVEGGAEVNAYGGTGSGSWTCGPAARVQYGGLGGRGRIYFDAAHPAASDSPEELTSLPNGFSLGGGGAWESRRYSLLDCRTGNPNDEFGPRSNCGLPPTGPVSAVGASVGYDNEKFGLRLGLLRYGVFVNSFDPRPTYQFFPEVTVRAGQRTGLQVSGGLGSYDASTMLRPGLWSGAGFPIVSNSLFLGGHIGIHRTFDDNIGLRLQAQISAMLGSHVEAVFAGALSQGYSLRPEPEASLALRFNGGM